MTVIFTHPTPHTLIIIITLMNNQSNIIQLSHTFNNYNTVSPCTKIIPETSLTL
jgi:hypothetical protein